MIVPTLTDWVGLMELLDTMAHPNCNSDLLELFSADRTEDRNVVAGTAQYAALRKRDVERRQRASEILSSLSLPTKDDLYHAAWVFNHGDLPEEAQRAHLLATEAAQLGLDEARWLAAASFDRWCMYSGKPQKFGTQLVPDGVRYRVWDTEPGTTDADRAEHGVPPLSDQLRRADQMTDTTPQPPMEGAPVWLTSAVERWRNEEIDKPDNL